MSSSLITTVIILVSSIVLGSGILLYENSIIHESNLSIVIERYALFAEKCELGDKESEVKNKIFSAQKEYELNNDTKKAQQILEEVKPSLVDCRLQEESSIAGARLEDILTISNGFLGLIVSVTVILTYFGIRKTISKNTKTDESKSKK